MAHLSTYFSLEDPAGTHDVKRLKRELDGLPGVTSVSVSPGGCLAVDYDSSASKVNQQNRIKLMLATAQKNLEKELAK